MPTSFDSVSYTHLDVYKRQGLSYVLKSFSEEEFKQLEDVFNDIVCNEFTITPIE